MVEAQRADTTGHPGEMNFASRRDASPLAWAGRNGVILSGCDPSGIDRAFLRASGGVASLNPRLMAGIPSGWQGRRLDERLDEKLDDGWVKSWVKGWAKGWVTRRWI